MTSEEFRKNPMFLRNQFSTNGSLEMPIVKKSDITLDDVSLIGYDKLNVGNSNQIVHFFLDDYKFEVIWKNPEPRIEKLKQYRAILSPQFSLYTEMPLALKAYNIFRSRWCGAYLQSKGLKVIPSVVWGEPNTFWFCFDGIEKGSIIAVSTIGIKKENTMFLQGYAEMLKRIKPSTVICYGEPFSGMTGNIISINYAETNNLNNSKKFVSKGFGFASGVNSLPSKPSQLKHIFRNTPNHLLDSKENRLLLTNVANDENNYIGTDQYGNRWYSQIQNNGNQIWVRTRNGIINNGGVNSPPRTWDPNTGYNNPIKLGGKNYAYII